MEEAGFSNSKNRINRKRWGLTTQQIIMRIQCRHDGYNNRHVQLYSGCPSTEISGFLVFL